MPWVSSRMSEGMIELVELSTAVEIDGYWSDTHYIIKVHGVVVDSR